MNDSPALGGIHRVDDIQSADDFSKKHVPYLAVTRDGDQVTIAVEVGHYVAHPDLPDHWIDFLEILANQAPVATYNFAAGVVAPKITATAKLDPGTIVTAIARCNLHGVWLAETTV
jgi:superoxide reductase